MHLNTTNAFLPQKTIRVKKHDELYLRIQNKKLLGAPGLTTRNKKLLGTPGIATRSKDATRGMDLGGLWLEQCFLLP